MSCTLDLFPFLPPSLCPRFPSILSPRVPGVVLVPHAFGLSFLCCSPVVLVCGRNHGMFTTSSTSGLETCRAPASCPLFKMARMMCVIVYDAEVWNRVNLITSVGAFHMGMSAAYFRQANAVRQRQPPFVMKAPCFKLCSKLIWLILLHMITEISVSFKPLHFLINIGKT